MVILADRHRETLDCLPHMVWVGGADGHCVYCNDSWRDFTGLDAGTCERSDWIATVHPEDLATALRNWRACLDTSRRGEFECRLRDQSGHYRWFLVLMGPQRGEAGNVRHCYITCTNIEARVQSQNALRKNIRLQDSMLDASVDCIKIIDLDGSLQHMNKSGCVALGVPEGDTRFGMKWLPLLPTEVHQRGQRALNIARRGKNARFAGYSVTPCGKPQHWDNLLTPMKNDDDGTVGILCVSRDVTSQRQAEKRLRVASEVDTLTGLMNRRSFNANLSKVLGKSREKNSAVGLVLIDLDYFKHVNDTLGHPAGDHLLRVLSRRLKSCLPETGFVARLGGDEFAVVIGDVPDEAAVVSAARRLLLQTEAPITYSGRAINGGMSIGCAMFPRDARDASSLMKCADTALNDLKAGGRGGVRVFDKQMMAAAQTKADQLIRARQIIRDDLVEPHYQPKVRLSDGSLIGFEALLRWRCPVAAAPQPPDAIAEAFKDYELATRLADAMQRKVLGDLKLWLAKGLRPLPVSINTASVEFLRDDFAENLLRRMAEFDIPHSLLEIEITEDMLAERGSDYVARALRALKKAGLRIALDDFGTGHSSLNHLTTYPVDVLKIDCGFVNGMLEERSKLVVVEAIGKLGPSLSLEVVAEGIEVEAQRDILLRAGYQSGQGFLFGKAVPAEQVAGMIA